MFYFHGVAYFDFELKGALRVSPTIVLDNLEMREILIPLDVRLLSTKITFPKSITVL